MPILRSDQWLAARADYETGKSQSQVALKYGVSRKAIQKRIDKEGWRQDDLEPRIRLAVAEKVADLPPRPPATPYGVAGRDEEKTLAAIDAEAERRAEVERRHRGETNVVRERLATGLAAHKIAGTAPGLTTADKMEQKKLAFEDLKAAKITAEALGLVQQMERRSFKLDLPGATLGKVEIELTW